MYPIRKRFKWKPPAIGKPRDLQELDELESYLLTGVRIAEPLAVECISGTRTGILTDIAAETDNPYGANIICIRGAPGSGKSSISLTAKSRLRRQCRLIAYFRFDRNEAATTTATALWRSVAYGLGRQLPSVRTQLLRQLRHKKVDLKSSIDVFASLVETPLSSVTSGVGHPLVIVVDGLDECGGLAGHLSQDRQILLQILRRWPRLPKHFKLLITSRPEGDITRVLSSISTIIEIPSGHFITENPQAKGSIDSSNDIRMFLEGRFRFTRQGFPSLPADWPGSKTIDEMTRRAGGIFMWATTAANFIDLGIDPTVRLQDIIADASNSNSMEPLYSLYATVLKMAFGNIADDSCEAEILRSVLMTMVLAKRPLDDAEYTKLPTAKPITQVALDGIRGRLGSVLAPGSLRFVHKSFDDFLLSKACPNKYAIKEDKCHYLLTKLCLVTMTEGLRFNMCGLETSCLKNADIPDLETKVSSCIHPLLTYSCCFLADHLCLTPFDEYLMGQVKEMVMDKLLYWLESMSLLREMNRVSHSLLSILKWSHLSPDEEFKDFLHDARRFVGAFGHPITQSTPQIYISALSFAPENSLVARHFLPQFPGILSLSTGKPTNWPSCIFTSEHHKGSVSCVAFSPDQKYFVSGSNDKTICVCDSETGNLISGPFKCDEAVRDVFFDPSSRRVWASCLKGKVTCWDIGTGDNILGFNTSEGVTYCRFNDSQTIISAGTATIALWSAETGACELHCRHHYAEIFSISPNGCYIARAELDPTAIRIWNTVNGSKILPSSHSLPRFRHTEPVSALSFSVDSNFAVSGSEDGTILIWDVKTGDTVYRPLATRTGSVWQVAYSHERHLLISSSNNTATVWNALSHEALLGPLEGHTMLIRQIALSRDGQRALTGSDDGTVRMWDLGKRSGAPPTSVNECHTSPVRCLAFSPCGKKLVSADLREIRAWDINTGRCLFKCETENNNSTLIFSPDGSRIVAYSSWDSTVKVWNADTGELAFQLNLSDGDQPTQIMHASFRSTDQNLVTCSSNGVVRIGSMQNGVQLRVVAKLPKIVALSPDGLNIIAYCDSTTPRHYIWSTTTHQPLSVTLDDDQYISLVPELLPSAFSPSGWFYASVYYSKPTSYKLRVWNIQSGQLVVCRPTFDERPIHSLAFSSDDRHIAISFRNSPSSSAEIWILDARTGQWASGPWSSHTDGIPILAFSPDGKKLASGSGDHQVRVWNSPRLFGDVKGSDNFMEVGTHMEDGWVKGTDGKLLFWVPKDHRTGLVWPHSTPFGSGTSTEVDISKFRCGENWIECFSGFSESRYDKNAYL